jgi:hypothetical protein
MEMGENATVEVIKPHASANHVVFGTPDDDYNTTMSSSLNLSLHAHAHMYLDANGGAAGNSGIIQFYSNQFNVSSSITASNDISASGNIIANNLTGNIDGGRF